MVREETDIGTEVTDEQEALKARPAENVVGAEEEVAAGGMTEEDVEAGR